MSPARTTTDAFREIQYGGESICKCTRLIEPVNQDSDSSYSQPDGKRIGLSAQIRTTYYASRRLLLAEVVPVFLLLAVPLCVHAGVFSAVAGMFADEAQAEAYVPPQNAQTVTLLKAATNIDPNPSKGGGDVIVNAGALVPEQGPGGDAGNIEVSHTGGEISVYTVREGDALSQIAEMFDVTMETILWANDLERASDIRPGDTLIILPISGVRYVVKEGDTLAEIAEEYEGSIEDIIAYNGLASASDIRTGQTVVIPGGEVPPPPAPKKSAPAKASVAEAVTNAVSDAIESVSGYFAHPVPGSVRTQGLHGYNGVDLGAPNGTAVRAAASGEVIISKGSGWNGGYGSYIVIKHPNGTQTLYAHNSANYVSAGQYVSQGETIGAVGSTGRSTGSHLHFEVRGATNPF